ncbi:MAG: two-component system response regulator GlrR, partial [Salinisphaera sp.]|nr:two-component system response regulator GlrR [Salinisphaera sp.]
TCSMGITRARVIPMEQVRKGLAHGATEDARTPALPSLHEARESFTRDYLSRLLHITEGNVSRSARLAKRNRTEFYKLLARHGVNPGDYKTVDCR